MNHVRVCAYCLELPNRTKRHIEIIAIAEIQPIVFPKVHTPETLRKPHLDKTQTWNQPVPLSGGSDRNRFLNCFINTNQKDVKGDFGDLLLMKSWKKFLAVDELFL